MNKPKFYVVFLLIVICCTAFSCNKYGKTKKQIISEIKEISDLSLVEINFKKILIFKQENRILIFKTKDATQVMRIYPKIELGIDLNQIEDNDIVVDSYSKVITITLPAISVKKFVYDEKNYGEVIGEFTGDNPFNHVTIDTIEEMHRFSENEIRKCINMIEWKQMCEERIKNNLSLFFASFGYSVNIEFKPTSLNLMSFNPDFKWSKLEEIKK